MNWNGFFSFFFRLDFLLFLFRMFSFSLAFHCVVCSSVVLHIYIVFHFKPVYCCHCCLLICLVYYYLDNGWFGATNKTKLVLNIRFYKWYTNRRVKERERENMIVFCFRQSLLSNLVAIEICIWLKLIFIVINIQFSCSYLILALYLLI